MDLEPDQVYSLDEGSSQKSTNKTNDTAKNYDAIPPVSDSEVKRSTSIPIRPSLPPNNKPRLRFTQECSTNTKGNKLHSFHWVTPTILVIISLCNVEVFEFNDEFASETTSWVPKTPRKSSKNTKRLNQVLTRGQVISQQSEWCHYFSPVSLLILATGALANTMAAYQFAPKIQEFIHLQKFKVDIRGNYKLDKKHIYIRPIYSVIYCIHSDRESNKVTFYCIGQNEVTVPVTIGNIPPFKDFFRINFVDNLVLVHNYPLNHTLVYDIKYRERDSKIITAPICPPAPMCIVSNQSSSSNTNQNEVISKRLVYRDTQVLIPDLIVDRKTGKIFKLAINCDAFNSAILHTPYLVAFYMRREFSRIYLLRTLRQIIENKGDLRHITEIFNRINRALYEHLKLTKKHLEITQAPKTSISTPDIQPQNKRHTAPDMARKRADQYFSVFKSNTKSVKIDKSPQNSSTNSPRSDPDSSNHGFNGIQRPDSPSELVSMSPLSQTMPESSLHPFSASSPTLGNSFAIMSTNYVSPSSYVPSTMNDQGLINEHKNVRSERGLAIITQHEMFTQVFCPLEDTPNFDYKVLVTVLLAYVNSLSVFKIPAESYIHELIINLLIRNKRYYQLHQLIQYRVISDSLPVACQLAYLTSVYPPALQLALDMFLRIGDRVHALEVLFTQGMLSTALKFIMKGWSQIDSQTYVPRFLEEAKETKNSAFFFYVYNFFLQRKEISQENCADYIKYYNETFLNQSENDISQTS